MSLLEPRTIPLKTGEDCLLRSAQESDAGHMIDNLQRILREPFALTAPDEIQRTEEQETAWIDEHRTKLGWIVIVAEVAGRVVGQVVFRRYARRRTAHTGSTGMSVQAPWRRQGIGQALMRALIEWGAAESGIEKVSLAVFADNAPAIGLYQKLGFVEEGRRRREIRLEDGTYRDVILMARFV